MKILQRLPDDNQRATSYSGLQQRGYGIAQDLMPRLDVDTAGIVSVVEEPTLIPHQFPRGASSGVFLHGLLEDLGFTQPVDPNWVWEKLELGGFESQWGPVLTKWITAVLQASLNETGVSLSQFPVRNKQMEMKFYLPISEPFTTGQLDMSVRQFDSLSAGHPPLEFMQVRGTLKGFIDLVFYREGRYYLLDYKSSWLSKDSSAYAQQTMATAMQAYCRDLRYQFHILALHRYLCRRIADYDYKHHSDGVTYLFLRGADKEYLQQGIYTTRPNAGLIALMDEMFVGMTLEEA